MYNRSLFSFKKRFLDNNSRKFISFGLFGDTHFQEKGLEKIQKTGSWLSEEFKKNEVDVIVCLGDVLNTRDIVNVEAQSAAFDMFNQMKRDNPSSPIHIVLGNHDMNLRHSRRISSLDGLRVSRSDIHLHTQITLLEIKGVQCLFIPYHHEPNDIIQYINELAERMEPEKMKEIVVFGHLSVHGAKQNDGRRFHGAVHAELFSPFKHTFSGHYHYHHTLENNVVYVGSPMQFNFGDVGDERGLVIYDHKSNEMKQIANTFSPRYYRMSESEIEKNMKENVSIFKDASVMIEFEHEKAFSVFQKLREELVALGCLEVRRFHALTKVIKNMQTQHTPTYHDIPMILEEYVKSIDKMLKVESKDKDQKSVQQIFENEEKLKLLIAEGMAILKKVDDRSLDSNSGLSHIFDADLAVLNIEGFMSYAEPVEIRFKDMNDGIWIIEGFLGANGSGKSSIFEAIVWCHFGVFLRTDLSKDNGINDNSKKCIVRLEYANGFVLERERTKGRPDDLRTFQRENNILVPLDQNEKGAMKNSQRKLNDHLGIDYKVFSKSVLLGQNILNNFITGSRDDRRSIIEEMLGLEKFSSYSEEARDRLNQLKISIEKLGEKSIENRKKISKFMDNIRAIETKKVNQEAELKQAQDNYDSEMKLKNERIAKVGESKESLEKQKLESSENVNKIKNQLQEIQQEETLNTSQVQKINQLHARVNVQRTELKEKAKKMHEHSEELTYCPLCDQPMATEVETKVHVDLLSGLKAILENSELSQYTLAGDDIDTAIALCSTITTDFDQKLSRNQKILDRVQKLQQEERDASAKFSQVELRLSQIENQYAVIEKEYTNMLHNIDKKKIAFEVDIKNHTLQIEEWQKEIQEIKSIEKEIEEEKLENEARYEISKFWDLAFDKKSKMSSGIATLRSYIFEESISELNVLLQEYMEQFSLGTRDLTSTLNNDLELAENYGRRSGGERKRTDLAVLFSLFELVRGRSRYLPRFIMLDEVFDSLDKNGKSAVRAILLRLSQQLKKIFIITHSDIAHGISTAGTINVEMQSLEGKLRTAIHIQSSE